MPSPKPVPLELSDEERQVLAGWTRRRTTAQALALRSRIVLECAKGRSNTEIAAGLAVSRGTVRKWRSRSIRERLEGVDRRTPARCAAEDYRRAGRTGDHGDVGAATAEESRPFGLRDNP